MTYGYDYLTQRPELFTEQGQVRFIRVRDRVQCLLKEAGAFRLEEAGNRLVGGDSLH